VPSHGIVLPWERGFAGLVLGLRRGGMPGEAMAPMPLVPLPPLQWVGPVPPPVKRPPTEPAATTTYQRRTDKRPRAARDGRDPDETKSVQRNLAVGKWQVLVQSAGHCCSKDLVDPAADPVDLRRSLEDVLRERATATLNKRAGSLLLYLRWGRARGYTDPELLPFKESVAYEYAKDLADDEAPATRASTFLEAALLATELLKLPSDKLLESARLKGAIYGSYERKRLTEKKDGLTANALWALEAIVMNEEARVPDRIFAGFAVWCALTRQRVGDALRVQTEPFLDPPEAPAEEAAYIETVGGQTKGGNVKRRRRLQLPIVCHARGLSDVPWAATWLALRRDSGMDASVDKTMQKAAKAGDDWARRSMTTEEFGDWLRMLTRESVPAEEGVRDYGAHSCKVTVLSWASKAGMPKPFRRILGSHAKVGDKTVAEYSRDELAEPLRMVELLFDWIRSGEFSPDANRSGRWSLGRKGPNWYPQPDAPGAPARAEDSDDGFGADVNSDASSTDAAASESGSADSVDVATVVPSDSSSEDHEDVQGSIDAEDRLEEEEVAAAAEALPVQADGERDVPQSETLRDLPVAGLFQHDPDDRKRARLMLHCGDPDNVGKLRCYRAIERAGSVIYRELFAWPLFSGGECQQCAAAEERDAARRTEPEPE
jgi:hypothetical protein